MEGTYAENIAMPRAKFCVWMGMRGRLNTKERVGRYMVLPDMNCIFCTSEVEDQAHLWLDDFVYLI